MQQIREIVVTLVVGGIVGWVASLVMKTRKQMGIVSNIIVGIVGGVLGSWLFSLLGLAAFGILGRAIMAVAGAIVLIALLKGFGVYK
jgi:uncharacterized membrane protein YeaQ/YmgE (transglycosylase-associated protein family)